MSQQLSKQWRRRWFETQSRSSWRHCNGKRTDLGCWPPVYPSPSEEREVRVFIYSGVRWLPWRLKSSVSPLFDQQFVPANRDNNKDITRRESTGECGERFHTRSDNDVITMKVLLTYIHIIRWCKFILQHCDFSHVTSRPGRRLGAARGLIWKANGAAGPVSVFLPRLVDWNL